MVAMLHGAQIVESYRAAHVPEKEAKKRGQKLEDFISKHSKKLLFRMIRYVYDEPDAPGARHGSGAA